MNQQLLTPKERSNQALEVVLRDMVGFEVEDFHEHLVWLAYCDPHGLPNDIEEFFDQGKISELLARELYSRSCYADSEDDFLFFWTSLATPWHVKQYCMSRNIDLERICREKFSRCNEPVRDASEALHIVHAIGPDAPKYWDALKYLVHGAEDVTAAMLENTLDMIDQVCEDLGIKLQEVDGIKQYDIEYLIDAVTELANQ